MKYTPEQYNSTLNFNYYNELSDEMKEAQLDEFKKINEIKKEAGEVNPADVHKNMKTPKISIVTAKFNFDSDGSRNVQRHPWGEPNYATDRVSLIIIDGKPQPEIKEYYYFTKGEHTVQYVLKDPTTIKEGTFSSVSYMTSVYIPSTVTIIEDEAFRYCNHLESVTFNNELKTIGISAFEGCSALDSLIFPKTLEVIDDSAFKSCTGLQLVDLSQTSTIIKDRVFSGAFNTHNVLTTPNKPNKLFFGNNTITDSSFLDSYVTDIDFGNVTVIPDSSFRMCNHVKNIITPNVEYIGSKAFEYSTIINSINLGNKVETIGTDAFARLNYNIHILEIIIPESVTSMGDRAVNLGGNAWDNYTKGTNVKVLSSIPPTVGTDVLGNWYRSPAKVYVPAASVDAYKAASGWSTYAQYIEAIPEE